MSQKPHPCKGCGFWRLSGAQKVCGYFDVTGTCRPCPAGEGCTVKDDPEAQARAEEHYRRRRLLRGKI